MQKTLKQNILKLNGVTRFDIIALRLERYLLHDKPFAVFCGDGFLHLKLTQQKCRELMIRYKKVISTSSVYKGSNRWVMLNPSNLDAAIIWQLINEGYALILKDLPELTRLTLLKTTSPKYSVDYSAIMQKIASYTGIDFDDRIDFNENP